jgi:hypothetical protein
VPKSGLANLPVVCAKFTSNVTFQQGAVPAVLVASVPSSDLNEIPISHFYRVFQFFRCLPLDRHKLLSFRDI